MGRGRREAATGPLTGEEPTAPAAQLPCAVAREAAERSGGEGNEARVYTPCEKSAFYTRDESLPTVGSFSAVQIKAREGRAISAALASQAQVVAWARVDAVVGWREQALGRPKAGFSIPEQCKVFSPFLRIYIHVFL